MELNACDQGACVSFPWLLPASGSSIASWALTSFPRYPKRQYRWWQPAQHPVPSPQSLPGIVLLCSTAAGTGARTRACCLAVPWDQEYSSLMCLPFGGISLSSRAWLGHGMLAGKGYPVSPGFLLPSCPLFCQELPSCCLHQWWYWAAPDCAAGAPSPSQPKAFDGPGQSELGEKRGAEWSRAGLPAA